jgi:hypothetical protein
MPVQVAIVANMSVSLAVTPSAWAITGTLQYLSATASPGQSNVGPESGLALALFSDLVNLVRRVPRCGHKALVLAIPADAFSDEYPTPWKSAPSPLPIVPPLAHPPCFVTLDTLRFDEVMPTYSLLLRGSTVSTAASFESAPRA